MADSPSIKGSSLVSVSISSNGRKLDDDIQLVAVSVDKRINKIPAATIVLVDGDMPGKDFPLSNSAEFVPGAEIKIDAGYGGRNDTIFEGVVVKHAVSISGQNVSRLVVECRDKVAGMAVDRRNATYVALTDGDIVGRLIRQHDGLSADVATTSPAHSELVQYYCTDWDFMLARAEVNGLLVTVEAGKVSVQKPDTSSAATLRVTYGVDLMEFYAEIDARSQLKSVTSVSWDPSAQDVVEETASPGKLNNQGNLDSGTLAKTVGPETFRLQTSAPLDKETLGAWAKARQVKAGLARIRGEMKFQGSAKAEVGKLLEIDGVGDRFKGDVFVSAVRHEISGGQWRTEVEFGMAPEWFTERADVVAPPASGWTAGIEGLHVGVVMKLDENPEGEPKIQVSVPVLQAESDGVWARLANPYASESFGSFFIPEIGDEVLLGFLANDPSYPVVLGSMFSSKRAPPYELTADNFTKAIVTRSLMKIEFDDEKKIVTIETPAENRIVVNDDEESILVEDQTGNKVELAPGGITLDSPKDIRLSAKGKVTIDAVGEIAITSKADLAGKGMNVNLQADVGFTAKGSSSAELSASGQTTVKGAMVMIN